jgi:hypothetical protein
MDGSNSRNAARYRRLAVEELEGRIVLSTSTPGAGVAVPAPAGPGPAAAAAQPVHFAAPAIENSVSYSPMFGTDPVPGKLARHEPDDRAGLPPVSAISGSGNYRPDGGDHPGEPDLDASRDRLQALIRQGVSTQFQQASAPDGEANNSALLQVAKPDQAYLLPVFNPGTPVAGLVPPGKGDATLIGTTVAGQALAMALKDWAVAADDVANLLGPLSDMPKLDAVALGAVFAEAFHATAATDLTDAVPALLPALVAPVSFSLSELHRQVDGFFARLSPPGATVDVLANPTWVVPWLMVVSAVAFEFARQRRQPTTLDGGLPQGFPAGIRSFAPEVRDES